MSRSERLSTAKAPRRRRSRRSAAVTAAGAVIVSLMAPWTTAPALGAPVGQGFNLNRSDLRFILSQIKISEEHARTATPANPCATLLGPGANQIPNANPQGVELPWGLRTVDGTCNNLLPGKERFGAADNPFPRLAPAMFRDAQAGDPDGPGAAPSAPTSYSQKQGTVFDSEPRTVSNLIVDQSKSNPAAVAVSGADEATVGAGESLFIPNTAPDVGLSAPFNSMFTLFGQFFDHGLDLTTKGGGTIFMPLKADDPLYVAGGRTNFMVLTRATNRPGPDGVLGNADDVPDATNTTTAFVDQNQTYTSHPSHQVFLREFVTNAAGDPVETGRLITGADDAMATWAAVKAQAATLLGIKLVDTDVSNVPMLATDPYGNFIRGANGYPQLVTAAGLVEGDPTAEGGTGVAVPANAQRTGHSFLDDIAHHAVPVGDVNPADGPNQIVPLAPDSNQGTTDDGDRATYDDEMLNAHFIGGDGRLNENIGLTAVHQVFHSEHNRLVGDIKSVITTTDATMLPEWQNADGTWDGDRLFQASRFVTEMEYQHLVFEEFARKMQPMVNVFGEAGTGYKTTIDPAIQAEFAHSVYRFGHSMLNETVDRTNADGSNNDVGLIEAFLNPPEYYDGGSAGTLTPKQAAGSIVRGMSRQVGNQIDEFVTGALRNNLLGLPLDLATLNLARGRDTGVPSLNRARRAFYAASNNTAVAPYTSWADLAYNLRNRESLVNFIAAYGSHETIRSADTTVGKRAAAQLLLDQAGDSTIAPEVQGEAYDFLNSTGRWANESNGVTVTGVDDIDLWVGGLAEKPMVFGGMLGATNNYVFENQMEDLQNGDRFYYLKRAAGLNLLTQLEGNSFAELTMRNTDVSGLPADAFSRPDFVFDMSKLGTTGPVLNDPATEWNESTLLTRMPDGTIRFGGGEHVVFNGGTGLNRMWSSEGDDTLRGNDGNDWMQGGDGNDNLIGGLGDDILNDLAGDDTLKGGDGNDALSSGQGFGGDLNQGGRGKDFVFSGNDTTETFAGADDDFVFAGDAEGTVFGDDGDDWLEAGKGPFYLLAGDNGAPFQDDLNEPGHDVFDGDGGEMDYDAEGGDDVMLAGPGIQRSEGMAGFDYVTHKGDPAAADSDMNFTGLLPPAIGTNVDRFDGVEALSGWDKDDILRGNSLGAADLGTEHQLNAEGIARVNGLAGILPTGTATFNAGNIILGGTGSDLIEGRGGDDVIDGDAWLNARLSVRSTATPATEIGSADGMNKPYLAGSTTTLQQAVFAGTVNPGNIVTVREILSTPAATDVDTALFTGARADYTITNNAGTITVAHNAAGIDGTDTLRNIEQLRFTDQTITVSSTATTAPGAPTIGTASAGNASATVSWTPPASDGGSPITGYRVQAFAGTATAPLSPETSAAAGATSATVTGLTNGTSYTFKVLAVNAVGSSAESGASNAVTPTAPVASAPTVTAQSPLAGATGVALESNVTATFSEAMNAATITAARFTLRQGTLATGTLVGRAITYDAATLTATLNPNANLVTGTVYTARLLTGITDATGTALAPVSWSFTAGTAGTNVAPTVTAQSPAAGATGVAVAANVTATFSEAVTGVTAARFTLRQGTADTGTLVGRGFNYNATTRTATLNPNANLLANTVYTARLLTGITDTAGAPLAPVTWSFTTAGGATTTVPAAPVIGTAVAGAAGAPITATANWTAPTSDGGSPITGYRVRALRMSAAGAVLATTVSAVQPATSRSLVMTLPVTGNYRFTVQAINAVGNSVQSARSNLVAGA